MNMPDRTVARIAVMIAAAVTVALLGAAGIGYWWGRARESASASSTSATQPAEPVQRKVLYWYDPMVPDQHFDRPGKSPFMDMQLLPRYADETSAVGIAIAPDLRQNLGMRTVVVRRGRLDAGIRVPGTIGWDLRQERIVSARVDSIVDRLYVRAPFEPVRAGQPLASVIAPAWSTAIAETHALGQARTSSARALQSASQARLRALGLPTGAELGSGGRITLTSPVTGVVSEIGVREGQSAPTGTLLFRVNGTRTVWLEAAIPQAGITGIATGTPVEAAVDAWPGTVFRGRVETVLPLVDPDSRAQRARIVLDNPDGTLAPGMFAQITLRPITGAEYPLVPTDALIGGGTHTRVIVLGDDDRFRPLIVRTGRSSGGLTEILAGLKGGERIVASGQFLIDSEANLSGALERLGAGPAESPDAARDEAATPSKDTSAEEDPHRPDLQHQPDAHQPDAHQPDAHQPDAHQPDAHQPDAHQRDRHQPDLPPSSPAAPSPHKHAIHAAPPKPAGRKAQYAPMVPDQRFDKPGKSLYMDMALVPRYADGTDPAMPEPRS